jgi:hypothetical protein
MHVLKVLGVVVVRRDRKRLAFLLGGTLKARRRCGSKPTVAPSGQAFSAG